jgi:hypothetical protein
MAGAVGLIVARIATWIVTPIITYIVTPAEAGVSSVASDGSHMGIPQLSLG